VAPLRERGAVESVPSPCSPKIATPGAPPPTETTGQGLVFPSSQLRVIPTDAASKRRNAASPRRLARTASPAATYTLPASSGEASKTSGAIPWSAP
jgi:hypothetical protein